MEKHFCAVDDDDDDDDDDCRRGVGEGEDDDDCRLGVGEEGIGWDGEGDGDDAKDEANFSWAMDERLS